MTETFDSTGSEEAYWSGVSGVKGMEVDWTESSCNAEKCQDSFDDDAPQQGEYRAQGTSGKEVSFNPVRVFMAFVIVVALLIALGFVVALIREPGLLVP